MLKRWAQLGEFVANKLEHRAQWQAVLREKDADELPDVADLDQWAMQLALPE